MSPQKLILSHKFSLTRIIQSCNATARISPKPLPLLTRSHTMHSSPDNPLLLPKPQLDLKQRAKLIKSTDFEHKMEGELDLRRIKVDAFCGGVPVSRQIRPVFWQIVHEYKRHFHPFNASRSENNTSDDPFIKTPRKVREMRERFHSQQRENEIRRLTVLSQVINQNNRKEARLRRQKSHAHPMLFL